MKKKLNEYLTRIARRVFRKYIKYYFVAIRIDDRDLMMMDKENIKDYVMGKLHHEMVNKLIEDKMLVLESEYSVRELGTTYKLILHRII